MKLIQGNCLDILPTLPRVKCILIDPPDNIGLKYNNYKDLKDQEHYYLWIEKIISESLLKCQVFWISYNAIHDLEISLIVRHLRKTRFPSWTWDKIIWTYTFSQYNNNNFSNSYRPIIKLVRPDAKVYLDPIRIESERMRLDDSRTANKNGRVPSDVWDFPRITGNSSDRQDWHPTQHPLRLYERILRYSCSGDEVAVDLCAGSGTIFRASLLTSIDVIGIEIDEDYCAKLRELYRV